MDHRSWVLGKPDHSWSTRGYCEFNIGYDMYIKTISERKYMGKQEKIIMEVVKF